MKTVAHLGSLDLAQTLKLKLGSMGIEAFIPDEVSAGLGNYLFMNKQGIRLQVAENDHEKALEVVQKELDQIRGTEE